METGTVGAATWDAIYDAYAGTAEAVLSRGELFPFDGEAAPAGTVRELQQQLNRVAGTMPGLPRLQVTGRLGIPTQQAVRKFQNACGLSGNGRVNDATKEALADTIDALRFETTSRFTQFPGFDLRMGSKDIRQGAKQS